MDIRPLVLIDAVGLTPRLLEHAPRLRALARGGWSRPLAEVAPSVTCTAQASLLTGKTAREHGVVANGRLFRDTGEIRFWQQSNRLIEAEPLYATARRAAARRDASFRSAQLFWWFNQGADVDFTATPKPHYGADGSKVFGIAGTPEGFTARLEADLGAFPFHTFWGPFAGLPCTSWIARAAAHTLARERPELTLVYLPHLDYDPQRFGPARADMPRLVAELDAAAAPLLDAAERLGARVWVVAEYAHVDVSRPVYLNRALAAQGLLTVRDGPFGAVLDTFASRAFAVCDHQVAHVYVQHPRDVQAVADFVAAQTGVSRVYAGAARRDVALDHPHAGEVVAYSDHDAWFAYPYWLNDRQEPDFARTVDIHRKPGYDPCELLIDPTIRVPKLHLARRLIQKKLGFRTLFDVTPLDAALIRGSHGVPATDPDACPILIGDGPEPPARLHTTDARNLILRALFPDWDPDAE